MNIAILGAGNGGQAMAAHFAMLGNRELATQLAPWPEDGQVIVLNPGRTLGAFEFSGILRDPSRRRFYIAEAQSLLYTFRFEQPGKVRITAVIFPPP